MSVFLLLYLMTAICFNNDKNAYRRFGSLITQENELVDTSWQPTGGNEVRGNRKKNYSFNRYNTSTKSCLELVKVSYPRHNIELPWSGMIIIFNFAMYYIFIYKIIS